MISNFIFQFIYFHKFYNLACQPNPCGQGECISQNGNYFCRCPPGFTGPRCETCDVNYKI